VTDGERADGELLIRLRTEPELIGVLYERHARAVFRYLRRRAGAAPAEDLLSEVFVAALDARKRVVPHGSGSALPWLYGIAGNVLRRHMRTTAARGGGRQLEVGAGWEDVDSRLDAQAQRDQLRAALAVLSPAERDVLLLVAWEGLSPSEAARALGISKVAARGRLHRARRRALRVLMPDLDDDPQLVARILTDTLTQKEQPT
jgi:RNA polymerase sigma factor (sigma-70 family)